MSVSSFDAGVFELKGRKRVFISGDSTFRDYRLLREKVDLFLFYYTNPIVCIRGIKGWDKINGGVIGAEVLAEKYATKHFYLLRIYSLNSKNKKARQEAIREEELLSEIDFAVFFWNGENEDTKDLIDLVQFHSIKTKVVKY